MRRLLLAIAIVLLFTGCYSPTKIPTVSTYTAPDYSYSFNYPGDWVDITSTVSPEFMGNWNSSGWQLDIALGLYKDEYHDIGIGCLRATYPQPVTLEEVENWLSSTGIETSRVMVNGKDAVVGSDDTPSRYETTRYIYLSSGNTLFYFCIGADGKSYYESFDYAYSTFINSLQVR